MIIKSNLLTLEMKKMRNPQKWYLAQNEQSANDGGRMDGSFHSGCTIFFTTTYCGWEQLGQSFSGVVGNHPSEEPARPLRVDLPSEEEATRGARFFA